MVFGVAKERAAGLGRGGEGDGDGDGEEGGGGYTMDVMLRSLNVELAVVGFDEVGQRWVG